MEVTSFYYMKLSQSFIFIRIQRTKIIFYMPLHDNVINRLKQLSNQCTFSDTRNFLILVSPSGGNWWNL